MQISKIFCNFAAENVNIKNMSAEQTKHVPEERSLNEALQHGITLEESKKRLEEVIHNHFHARVCA